MSLLQEKLSEKCVLLADGATGSVLQEAAERAGLPGGMSPELLTLQRPDLVLDLHRQYIEAGSDIILTNTFGGTRPLLRRRGLEDRLLDINRGSAWLAREAAGKGVVVLGDLGPTGESMAPGGDLSIDEARAAYQEQAAALTKDDAVNGLLIETMSDLGETAAAVEGARAATTLPILVTMSFDTHGRTMRGVHPTLAARKLWELGVEIIGANCGGTVDDTLLAIRAMRRAVPNAILMAKPNAGAPRYEDGVQVYNVSPQTFAQAALRFVEDGVRVFGGCCGTNPDYIRAAREALACAPKNDAR